MFRGMMAALALALPGALGAQETIDGCAIGTANSAQVICPMLAGEWKATNGPGVLVLVNARMTTSQPLKSEGGEDVIFSYQEGQLLAGLKREGAVPSAAVTPVTERPPAYGIPFLREMNGQTVEVVRIVDDQEVGKLKCDASFMPKIGINGTVTEADGTERRYSFLLHVISEKLMSGMMAMDAEHDGEKATMRRLVTLKKAR